MEHRRPRLSVWITKPRHSSPKVALLDAADRAPAFLPQRLIVTLCLVVVGVAGRVARAAARTLAATPTLATAESLAITRLITSATLAFATAGRRGTSRTLMRN
jgi:hypothetical protein